MREAQAIAIICGDPGRTEAYLRELERGERRYEVRVLRSPAEARRQFIHAEPTVTLLDESAVGPATAEISLEPAVAMLTGASPVVVVAAPERQAALAFLISSGAVDFVARTENDASVAAGLLERRVRLARQAGTRGPQSEGKGAGDFGEILRHEVNNPLTGILGNAELLLSRRDHLPPAARRRVETIAELAVRLRETVRRLSHDWEGRQDQAGPA